MVASIKVSAPPIVTQWKVGGRIIIVTVLQSELSIM
jgi:hypothetical protein